MTWGFTLCCMLPIFPFWHIDIANNISNVIGPLSNSFTLSTKSQTGPANKMPKKACLPALLGFFKSAITTCFKFMCSCVSFKCTCSMPSVQAHLPHCPMPWPSSSLGSIISQQGPIGHNSTPATSVCKQLWPILPCHLQY